MKGRTKLQQQYVQRDRRRTEKIKREERERRVEIGWGEAKYTYEFFWLPYITLRVHPCNPPSVAAAAACAAANQFGSIGGGPPFCGFAAAIAFKSTPWNTFSHAIVLPE
jgi:hypothetical protein